MPAMEAKLGQNLKMAKMKERMKAKADENRAAREASSQQPQAPVSNVNQAELDEKLINMFNDIGKPERSSRGAPPSTAPKASNNKKKKSKK